MIWLDNKAYYKILKIVELKDICQYLVKISNRKFKVRLSNTLCEGFEQEAGVSQGGILSAILFILKINNIINCLG